MDVEQLDTYSIQGTHPGTEAMRIKHRPYLKGVQVYKLALREQIIGFSAIISHTFTSQVRFIFF